MPLSLHCISIFFIYILYFEVELSGGHMDLFDLEVNNLVFIIITVIETICLMCCNAVVSCAIVACNFYMQPAAIMCSNVVMT